VTDGTARLACSDVCDAAPEFALGILPPEERAAIARHLLTCRECRREVEELSAVGDDLLGLIPDAEPPVGFERKVLATMGPRRRRPGPIWAAAGVAAAAAVAAILATTLPGSTSHPHELTARLLSDGRVIGSVYTEGHPPWLWMTVHDSGTSGSVTCELLSPGGTSLRLGTFDLVDGSGSWAAPEPAGRFAEAQLVAADGTVIGTATFPS